MNIFVNIHLAQNILAGNSGSLPNCSLALQNAGSLHFQRGSVTDSYSGNKTFDQTDPRTPIAATIPGKGSQHLRASGSAAADRRSPDAALTAAAARRAARPSPRPAGPSQPLRRLRVPGSRRLSLTSAAPPRPGSAAAARSGGAARGEAARASRRRAGTASLQVGVKYVQLAVGLVQRRAGVGEHPQVHQRLVHVLGQEDDAHVEDDVLHQEGVVQDQHVDEEQAHVEHIGQHQQRVKGPGLQRIQPCRYRGGHAAGAAGRGPRGAERGRSRSGPAGRGGAAELRADRATPAAAAPPPAEGAPRSTGRRSAAASRPPPARELGGTTPAGALPHRGRAPAPRAPLRPAAPFTSAFPPRRCWWPRLGAVSADRAGLGGASVSASAAGLGRAGLSHRAVP